MEKPPGPIENPDHAWEVAHAEKPLRDIAREEWVSEDQKEALDALAEQRGEETLSQLLSQEVPQTDAKSENNIESHEAVEKMMELVKNNPNINLIIDGNGNVLAEAGDRDRNGQSSFYFDTNKQQMVPSPITLDYDMQSFSNRDENFIPYKTYWKFTTLNKSSNNLIVACLPFNPTVNNPYTKEHRPGTHLSFGLAYKNNIPGFLDSLGNETLKGYLQNPDTEESKNFFTKVFTEGAKEFTPKYWEAFVNDYNSYKNHTRK
ncbi:MAG: hypothetical protein ABIO57_01005 [Candidatus Paceibacterota bacterium]